MDDQIRNQVDAALGVLRAAVISARILGVYVYGSSVHGELRPDSDLDLFVVTDRPLKLEEKSRIVDGLLPISGREVRPPSWRPLDVTVVAQSTVRPWRYPPRMELQYGEWLRAALLAGEIEPQLAENPDLGVLVAIVRERSVPLIGPPARDIVDAVPRPDLVRAMVEAIPDLLGNLADDTRNVLLTLARIWMTVATGDFRSKDAAADWALGELPEESRPMLARARDLYRQGGFGDWDDRVSVSALAEALVREIRLAAVL
jgi:predicted nucleotidyltransferase